MAERVSQTLSRFTQREVLAHYISDLTNPVFIAIPIVLGVWHGGTRRPGQRRCGGAA